MKHLGDLEDYLNDAIATIPSVDESVITEDMHSYCAADDFVIEFAPGEENQVAEYLMKNFGDSLLSDYTEETLCNEIQEYVQTGNCKVYSILPCELIVKDDPEHQIKTEGIWGNYEAYNSKDGWTKEDIELHKAIDWNARNYRDFPVEDDSFVGTVYCYGFENPISRTAKMCKYIRSNPIFPPYYAAIENPFEDMKGIVGPMFDGRKHAPYDIHDRYETQQLYDLLSEKLNVVKEDDRKLYRESIMSTSRCALSEASYGGAFDIEDDQFFTKEELIEFANSIIDQLKENNINRNIELSDLYMEDNMLTIELAINDYNEQVSNKIDMRRIGAPRDIDKYKNDFINAFEDLCRIDMVDA